ncbi:methyltransferase domain-containing protein [Saccharopolyspora sp. NPDC050389]|uniref:methyltransferase domain-containing protein n=1 Tax=Saccharopolyspora sp. NPDC050389 TaxID=3155516 RepID=UPI0033E197FA
MSTANLIQALDRFDALPEAVRLRERSYALLAASGAVVDVGCGAGTAVAELRERGVRAIGLDVDEGMIAAAAERYPAADFRVGDACELPFADGELAGYRAEKVFHSVPDPDLALAEARRVLAPGGRVVLLGQDWEAIIVDADDMAITRTMIQSRLAAVPSPHSARRYRNLLLDRGFRDITMEVHTGLLAGDLALPLLTGLAEAARATGSITAARAQAWIAEQRRRAETDRLFCAVPIFLAATTNP